MAMQAQDTFVAQLDDGTERFVAKGDVLSDGDELVKRDRKGGGLLFKPLDLDGAPKSPAKKAEAEKTPVRDKA